MLEQTSSQKHFILMHYESSRFGLVETWHEISCPRLAVKYFFTKCTRKRCKIVVNISKFVRRKFSESCAERDEVESVGGEIFLHTLNENPGLSSRAIAEK